MSDGLLGVVGVAVGAFLGYGLTLLSNWHASRAENRRIRNRMLYFLLELHHEFSKLSKGLPEVATIFDQYLEETPELAHLSTDLTPAIRKTINHSSEEALYNSSLRAFSKIAESYPGALLDLAAIDPISAYRVHGLAELLQNLDSYNSDYVESASEQLNEAIPDEARSLMRKVLSPNVVSTLLTAIEEVITKLTDGPFRYRIHRLSSDAVAVNRQFDEGGFRRSMFEYYDTVFTKLGLKTESVTINEDFDLMDWAKNFESSQSSDDEEE